jgi:hypothetical protein
MSEQEQQQEELTDEEAIMRIAQAMKDNAPSADEKHNVHTFLNNIIQTREIENVSKVGNIIVDKEIDEMGYPAWNVRGSLEMARISDKLMGNAFFKEYFEASAIETFNTSLSRQGFLVKQGTTQTKQVADVTRRRKINKGWFGKEKVEESGGETN